MAPPPTNSVHSSTIPTLSKIFEILTPFLQVGNIRVLGESVDIPTFEQILEMDDDDDRDFSREIVYGFFDQAESTFAKMEQAM